MTESMRPYIWLAQKKDKQAMEVILAQYFPLIRKTMKKHSLSYPDPQEAQSLACYSIIHAILNYNLAESTPVEYSMVKTMNRFFKNDVNAKIREGNHVEKNFIVDGQPSDLPDNIEDKKQKGPMDTFLQREREERLKQAVATLPRLHQQILKLYYREGYTLKEIGNMVGHTQSHISKLLKKSQQQLKVMLEKEYT